MPIVVAPGRKPGDEPVCVFLCVCVSVCMCVCVSVQSHTPKTIRLILTKTFHNLFDKYLVFSKMAVMMSSWRPYFQIDSGLSRPHFFSGFLETRNKEILASLNFSKLGKKRIDY